MRLLAIESATSAPSVALVDRERIVAERAAANGAPGSEGLLPEVAALLGEAGLGLADLDGFAIAIGPGSFTGLRVGLATLKGLAFGDPRPVAAVSTLEALARRAGDPRPAPVAALMDARRGELYGAVWGAGADPAPLVAEGVHRPEALAGRLPAGCLLVGDAAEDFPAEASGARIAEAGAVGPCAGHVGVLGARALAAGNGLPAAELVPRYLRRAEAEARRTGQPLELL